MADTKKRVVVLGASDQLHRYSNMAMRSLIRNGYEVIPIHPVLKEIEGIPVVKSLSDVQGPVDTVTLYVGSSRVDELSDNILAIKPMRIVANPGAESSILMKKAKAAGIEYTEACTLIMLSTDQF